MTVREQIQAAIKTLQLILADGAFAASCQELLDQKLPEEYLRMEVQVPAIADCDALAYIELIEECEPDEDHPNGGKTRLIKL